MGTVKQLEIKNWTYYFYNDLINLNDFNACLLKIDKVVQRNWHLLNRVCHCEKNWKLQQH